MPKAFALKSITPAPTAPTHRAFSAAIIRFTSARTDNCCAFQIICGKLVNLYASSTGTHIDRSPLTKQCSFVQLIYFVGIICNPV